MSGPHPIEKLTEVRKLPPEPTEREHTERCPTCGRSGPDIITTDFDTGAAEADCGDEFHRPSTERQELPK